MVTVTPLVLAALAQPGSAGALAAAGLWDARGSGPWDPLTHAVRGHLPVLLVRRHLPSLPAPRAARRSRQAVPPLLRGREGLSAVSQD